MTASALSARALSCRRGGRQVVRGVDLDVAPGVVCGLLGPNGAGKTTIFRLLAGLLSGQGSVHIGTRDVSCLPTHRRALLGLGYLPQEPTVFCGLTVEANLLAVLELRKRDTQLGVALLERFGLAHRRNQVAGTLSGGERRRLELARLVAGDPKVILLDEPFTALDPMAVGELERCILELAAQGVAVLLSDHRVETALTICHRACILETGRIVCDGPTAQLRSMPAAQEALFGLRSMEARSE